MSCSNRAGQPEHKSLAKHINITLYHHLFIWPPAGALNARANPSACEEWKNIIHRLHSGTDGHFNSNGARPYHYHGRYGNNNIKIITLARRVKLTNFPLRTKSEYDAFIDLVIPLAKKYRKIAMVKMYLFITIYQVNISFHKIHIIQSDYPGTFSPIFSRQ